MLVLVSQISTTLVTSMEQLNKIRGCTKRAPNFKKKSRILCKVFAWAYSENCFKSVNWRWFYPECTEKQGKEQQKFFLISPILFLDFALVPIFLVILQTKTTEVIYFFLSLHKLLTNYSTQVKNTYLVILYYYLWKVPDIFLAW